MKVTKYGINIKMQFGTIHYINSIEHKLDQNYIKAYSASIIFFQYQNPISLISHKFSICSIVHKSTE